MYLCIFVSLYLRLFVSVHLLLPLFCLPTAVSRFQVANFYFSLPISVFWKSFFFVN